MKRATVWLPVSAIVLAIVAYAYYPPFRLFAWFALGRGSLCPLGNALESGENLKRQIEFKDKILGASKLLEKDPKGFHLWDTPAGKYWIPEGDDFVLPFNLAEQQRKIYGTGAQEVKAGDIVLDCGANVGVFTRVALDRGAKTVVMIEPAPENIECLRRNFPNEIAAGRVILYPKGVWNKEDVLTLHVDPHNTAADSFIIQHEGEQAVEKIPLTTVDKLVAELKLDRVDYIKMDIEGAEPKALTGAHDTLAKFKPRLSIASYHQPDHPRLIPAAILAARPDYTMECGPCAEAGHGVRPDVLYFH
jgi:FkbM family methyltransferase